MKGKCRNAKAKGWLKVWYSYERGPFARGADHMIFNVENTKMKYLKEVLSQYFSEWSGQGSCTVSSVDTGPFLENQLSERQLQSFEGITYNFGG